jgi:hypothetical protein
MKKGSLFEFKEKGIDTPGREASVGQRATLALQSVVTEENRSFLIDHCSR